MTYMNIALLLTILLVLFVIYKIIGLFRKKAKTSYLGEDGKFHKFGDAAYDVTSNAYVFHDNNQPSANRYQGNSNVENGIALINLRKDPSINDLENEVRKEGWVDLAGNIYGSSGFRLGYITDLKGRRSINGSGKWYELWLRKHSYVFSCPPLASENGDSEAAEDRPIGKIIESGRFFKAKPNQYTTTARAGGFLLLYKDRQPKPQSEDAYEQRTTWKDTAFPATLIFALIFGIFYLSGAAIPAFGEQIGFTAAMLLVYFAIWAILRQIKIESALEGKSFDDFLMMIDRNTGLGGMNNWIIIIALASILLSIFIYDSDFMPLEIAILIGAWVNRKYITKEPWEVTEASEESSTRLPDWPDNSSRTPDGGSVIPDDGSVIPDDGSVIPDDGSVIPDGGSHTPDASTPDDSFHIPDDEDDIFEANMVEKTYDWTLDSLTHKLNGHLTLKFNPEKIAALRATNPFRLTPTNRFEKNIAELLKKCTNNKKVHEVLRYIDSETRKAGLSELDRMQFILDFVQKPNIKYRHDETSDEIGRPWEYARFPDETMYDKRGDCDCKAVLAAILFREAGYKTAFVTTPRHAAVAVAFKNKNANELISLAELSLLTKDGYMYFFCETTSDGFKIGDLGTTTTKSINNIIFLN